MKTITEMRAQIEALQKKIGDLRAKAIQENRDMTVEEIETQGGYMDQIDNLMDQIESEERRQAQNRRLETPAVPPIKPNPKPSAHISVEDQRENDKFQSFGEQLMAVMAACKPGGAVDPRLRNAASGLNEGKDSEGGFLVQTEFSSEIIQNVWNNGAIPSRMRRISLSGNSNSMTINGIDETSRANGSRAGGIQSYWAAEAAEKTSSKPKFRQIELKLNKLIGLCYGTDELIEDASALEAVITDGFNQEFDFKITDGGINGTGAGQMLGIMNAGCLVTVNKESGQAADTIKYENIVKMWARLIARSRPNAIWMINQDCEPQLHTMSLVVGTGGVPVYMPASGASGSPYSTLFGRPVIPVEQCSTVGDLGDIILGDWSQYVMIDKGGMKKDVSIHVRFIYDEQVFRFVYRCDGQPVLASAITPYKGTNTLSHFVTLQART